MTDVIHHLIALFLIIAFPIWDRIETRLLRSDPGERARLRSYRLTVGWLWIVTVILLLTTPLPSLIYPMADPWLSGKSIAPFVLGAVTAMLLAMGLPLLPGKRMAEARTSQREALERVSFFLPRTGSERRWFAGVSVSAGVCEELIFRGFLAQYFVGLPLGIAPIGAYLLSALVFGIDHGYQGLSGIVATGFLALVFTAVFLVTGSIWVPMLIHVLIDLRILLILPRDDSAALQ
ncbi:MAG: CPBP family intramembrane glutamic endopeptidase [Gemmatimonadales bacterium]